MATSLKVSLCVLLATAVLAASPEVVEGSPLGGLQGLVSAPDRDDICKIKYLPEGVSHKYKRRKQRGGG